MSKSVRVTGGNITFSGPSSVVYTVNVATAKTFTVSYTLSAAEPLQSLMLKMYTGRVDCAAPNTSAIGGSLYITSLNTIGYRAYGATSMKLKPSVKKITLCASKFTGETLVISDICISANCFSETDASPGALSVYPDPYCVDGRIENKYTACCHPSCPSCVLRKTCKNFEAGTQDIVLDKCCVERIIASKKSCDTNASPCIMAANKYPESSGGGEHVQRNVSVGLYTTQLPSQLAIRAVSYGERFDTALMYLPATLDALKWRNVQLYLDLQYDVHLVIEFYADDPLRDILAGKFDNVLVAFASAANTYTGSQKVYIRPLHESNSNWYGWSIWRNTASNVNIPDYLAAYRRIVELVRNAAPGKFLFQQHFNPVNFGNDEYVTLRELYAGDGYVDQVGVSLYNTCGTSSWLYPKTITDIFNRFYYQMTAITSRPISVGEMSTTDYCGIDKPAWVLDSWLQLATKYTRVYAIDWFLVNKPYGNVIKTWDMNTPAEVQAFAEGWAGLKKATRLDT
ncbi:glycoside hydrolase superfamily [Tribonema minus]|uniref:Glycoside hydrolase superfamily n=1 Tax=Tribonema minus TaxID=303371 RepID=A0A835Z3C0_9STRA|nr:glycoside hydrolase superfamily [Tribonema minus]